MIIDHGTKLRFPALSSSVRNHCHIPIPILHHRLQSLQNIASSHYSLAQLEPCSSVCPRLPICIFCHARYFSNTLFCASWVEMLVMPNYTLTYLVAEFVRPEPQSSALYQL